MVLTDSEVGSLNAALNRWEWFEYISTAIVCVGCVGEFIAEFTSLPKTEEGKHKLARLSLMVLILGIAGELLGTVRTSQISGQLIANIEERAENAEQRAREATERAERLRKDAEDERLARVKLESKVAWRKLGPKVQSEIASNLGRFAKEPALIAYNSDDIEAATFASDVAATLHASKWDVSEPLATMKMREGPVAFGTNPPVPTEVLVWCTNDEASRKAAAALVEQLSARGFDAIISAEARDLLGIHPTPTRVVVSVEHKPEGPQGEFKLQAEREANAKNKGNSR
jgi:hypothetical protein